MNLRERRTCLCVCVRAARLFKGHPQLPRREDTNKGKGVWGHIGAPLTRILLWQWLYQISGLPKKNTHTNPDSCILLALFSRMLNVSLSVCLLRFFCAAVCVCVCLCVPLQTQAANLSTCLVCRHIKKRRKIVSQTRRSNQDKIHIWYVTIKRGKYLGESQKYKEKTLHALLRSSLLLSLWGQVRREDPTPYFL